MKFTVEITRPEKRSNLGYKTIYFTAFKINIIERYSSKGSFNFHHIIVKLRTVEDEIINTKTGAGRIKIEESDFPTYGRLVKALTSYEFRNKLIDRSKTEDEFVNFILSRMAWHYQL
ncbi:prevent-host-death protein [Epilithonimonas zeae]|jgi:hypothetical protein|uniref:Prevent-host-death protein n=1 Tax=Epilithonimonas zeae TaxID=1416779 RepID=A0A1N6FWN9_9FLAO|nr:hypothetical protein [Epilithonimonas zeae]SIN99719.1 hypothetical protein SAMN05444409_1523 [Epilithonimonas zeae]